MEFRELGRSGMRVSSISFGAWAIGGTWGKVDNKESMAALHRALDLGVNFFDTADVYGAKSFWHASGVNGRSNSTLPQKRDRDSIRTYQPGTQRRTLQHSSLEASRT